MGKQNGLWFAGEAVAALVERRSSKLVRHATDLEKQNRGGAHAGRQPRETVSCDPATLPIGAAGPRPP